MEDNKETMVQKTTQEGLRLDAILSSMKEGLVMVDTDFKVILINQAASALLRIAPTEGVSKDIQNVFQLVKKKKKIPWAKSPIHKALKETNTVYIQLTDDYFCKDASGKLFPITMAITGLSGYGSIGGIVTFTEVTREKEIDRMKTEFVSLASHQLRTPLTAIRLFSEMLADEKFGKLSTEQRGHVHDIERSTERMIILVNELLNVSRIEGGKLKVEPKQVDLIPFLEDIIRGVTPFAKARKCKINLQKPKESIILSIDPALVRQVVHNLLTNAVRYSKESGGEITLKLDRKRGDTIIAVQDAGIGIPKEVQPRIFEKFFRADNAVKTQAEGSGLGLYIARLVMESTGGKLWFESEENKGTIFYIAIPSKGMEKKEGSKSLAK